MGIIVARVNVVGLGSSAGGLSALKEFFANMAPDSGLAFVVIQHLQPRVPALTRDILARVTSMGVITAQDSLRVQPNHVYTIPPDVQLTIADDHLALAPRTESSGRHHPFDRFLKSLAITCGAGATAVVFSGYDGDGSEGFVAIKAHGGTTYAQDGTATVGEMPASAIATGNVDHVLNPRQIAVHLSQMRSTQGSGSKPGGATPGHPSHHRSPRHRGEDS